MGGFIGTPLYTPKMIKLMKFKNKKAITSIRYGF